MQQSVCFCSSSLNRKSYKKSKNKITSTVIKEQSLWTSLKKIQMLTSQLLSSGITPVVLSSCCKDSHRLVSEVWSHVAPADPLPIHWSHFCASSDLLTFDLWTFQTLKLSSRVLDKISTGQLVSLMSAHLNKLDEVRNVGLVALKWDTRWNKNQPCRTEQV